MLQQYYKITWSYNAFDTDERNRVETVIPSVSKTDAEAYFKNYLINRGLSMFWIEKIEKTKKPAVN